MSPTRIGIIGCGEVLVAYRAAIDKLRLGGLAEVTIACGRESQRDAVRAQLGVQTFTTTASDVIGAANVDVVMVLTSMHQHAPLTRAALEAGKHVLVEKPIATS